MKFSYIVLLFGTAMAIWGSQTRGTQSKKLSAVGGAIWFSTLVYMFFTLGIKEGFIALFVSFVVGAIFQNIFPKRYR